MKQLLGPILAAFLAGCGSVLPVEMPKNISPELEPYVSAFYADVAEELPNAKLYPVQTVLFNDTYPDFKGSTVGVCISILNVNDIRKEIISGKVLIRTSKWGTLSDGARWFLLYHELSHCALGQDHSPESGTLMYKESPNNLTMEDFYKIWSYFLKQFPK